MSGLREYIRVAVRKFSPLNLVATFGLARMQEEYLSVRRRGLGL